MLAAKILPIQKATQALLDVERVGSWAGLVASHHMRGMARETKRTEGRIDKMLFHSIQAASVKDKKGRTVARTRIRTRR